MIPEHIKRTFLLSATAFILVLQFQNCAPVKQGVHTESSEDPNASSPVYAMRDSSSPGVLTFEKQKLELAPQVDTASIQAHCSGSIANAALAWKLLDPSGGPNIIEGIVECIDGLMQIDITPAQILACNLNYDLAIATSNRSSQSISINRHCP